MLWHNHDDFNVSVSDEKKKKIYHCTMFWLINHEATKCQSWHKNCLIRNKLLQQLLESSQPTG